MNDTKFDGECHAIPGSEHYGYVANRVEDSIEELREITDRQLEKYAEYICKYDRKEAIRIVSEVMKKQVLLGFTPENYQIIHRPPWIVGAMAQYGTVCIKFKRVQGDELYE